MTLTDADWKKLQKMLNTTFDLKFEENIRPIKEQISHLPTKEEFYAKMDKWMKIAETSDLEKASHIADHARINQFLKLHSTP